MNDEWDRNVSFWGSGGEMKNDDDAQKQKRLVTDYILRLGY